MKILMTILMLFVMSGCTSNIKSNEVKTKQNTTSLSLSEEKKEKEKYEEYTSDFKSIDIPEINKMKEDKNQFFLFIGFKDCPFCREFMPNLHKAIVEEKTNIYYLDTKNVPESRTNGTFDKFVEEIKLEYVPAMYYFNGTEFIKLDVDSKTTSVDDVKKFITKQKDN